MSLICQLGVALFTVVTIPAFIPFLRIILGLESEAIPDRPAGFLQVKYYQILDAISSMDRMQALLYLAGCLVVLFFLKNICQYGAHYFIAPVRNGVVRDLRQSLYEQMTRLPLSYHGTQRMGDQLSRMGADVIEVEWSILRVVESLVRQPFLIIGCLGVMLYIHAGLTVIVIGLIALTGILLTRVSRSLRSTSHLAQRLQGSLLSTLEETLGGLRVIKSYGATEHLSQRWTQQNNDYADTITRVLRRRDLASPLSEWVGIVAFSIILIIGAGYVFSGNLRAETFIAFLIAFFYIIEPAKALASAQFHLLKGGAALDRIEQVLHSSPVENIRRSSPEPLIVREGILFNQVSFNYENESHAVLSDINVHIPAGRQVALIGASGAGKTTLADLLSRFYEVSSGEILIDGRDIRQIPLEQLRDSIAIVTQDPILFHDTVWHNIAMGRPDVLPEALHLAARQAHAHEFISSLPQGYDTVLGDRGHRLSGGERQRIALARAILKSAPIIILDEATSALDAQSERSIQQALEQLLEGRTALIIAHRLSTIRHCDEILVLEQGHIQERGTHEQLIEQDGAYRRYLELQAV